MDVYIFTALYHLVELVQVGVLFALPLGLAKPTAAAGALVLFVVPSHAKIYDRYYQQDEQEDDEADQDRLLLVESDAEQRHRRLRSA